MQTPQTVEISLEWDADLASSQILADLLQVIRKAQSAGLVQMSRDDGYYRTTYKVESIESIERTAAEQAKRDAEIDAERAAAATEAESANAQTG